MKKITAAILITTLIFTLSSCNKERKPQTATVPTAKLQNSLSIFAFIPDTLNPLKTRYRANADVFSLICDGLFEVNSDLTVSPAIAESYRFDSGGLVCRITLKSNVMFHDGTPLDAKDVIYSLNVIKGDEESIFSDIFRFVQSYQYISPFEIAFTLSKPGLAFLYYMDFPIIKNGGDYVDQVIGTGAYMFESYSSHKDLSLRVNKERVTGSVPVIEQIIVKLYPEEEMRIKSLELAETDLIFASIEDLGKTNKVAKLNQYSFSGDKFTFLGFNNKTSPFANYELRKAVSLAIDRQTLADSIFPSYGIASNSPYKNGTIYHSHALPNLSHDLSSAKEVLSQSGYHDTNLDGFVEKKASPLKLKILVNNENSQLLKTAEIICQTLRAAGLDVNVSESGWTEYNLKIASGNYDMFIGEIEFSAPYDLGFLLNPSIDGKRNYFYYENEYVHSLFEMAKIAPTFEERSKTTHLIESLIAEDLPFISLYFRPVIYLCSKKLEGITAPSPKSIYSNIENWTIR